MLTHITDSRLQRCVMPLHTLLENYRTTYPGWDFSSNKHKYFLIAKGWGPGGGCHWCHFQIQTSGEKYIEMKMMSVDSQSTGKHTFRVKIGSCRGASTVEEAHPFHVLKLSQPFLCLMPFSKSLWASML